MQTIRRSRHGWAARSRTEARRITVWCANSATPWVNRSARPSMIRASSRSWSIRTQAVRGAARVGDGDARRAPAWRCRDHHRYRGACSPERSRCRATDHLGRAANRRTSFRVGGQIGDGFADLLVTGKHGVYAEGHARRANLSGLDINRFKLKPTSKMKGSMASE